MTTTARTKSLRFEVKDADQGTVEAVFATFNVKDFDDDYTLPGAFEDGAAVLISAYGHKSWSGLKPVGRGVIRVEEKRAVLVGRFFLKTIEGRDTFETIKETAELQEWSYGYDVLKAGLLTEELRQIGVRRVLETLKVFEVCPVMIGAGVDTETLGIKSIVAPPPAVTSVGALAELKRFEMTRARLAGRGSVV